MVPFIALGNATLVSVYSTLRARNRVLAVIVAAVAKFALLFAVVTLLSAHPLSVAAGTTAQPVKLGAAIVYMMQWPQLATALAGGALALGISEGVRRVSKR